MKIKIRFITGSFLALALALGFTGFGDFATQAAGAPERIIVTFNGPVNEGAQGALEGLGGKVLNDLPLVNGFVVLLPSEASVPSVRALAGVKNIETDAKVFALKPAGPGGDGTQPVEMLEWGVNRIDADLAWSSSRGAAIKVAIIDTGIDQDHADLVQNIRGGINFVAKSLTRPADPTKWNDDNGHGTHVSGIVAAVKNTIGVVGVAPEASLYAVKVLDRNGSGYVSNVINGITWAMNNGMQVINMSLGTASDVQALHDAVDAAYTAGVVLVAASGNSGDGNGSTNEVSYPAKYSSVIAVAATASDNSTPLWSSDGAEVELAAPGVNIRSAWNDGLYKTISGTSMATPHVTGTVALVLGTAVRPAYDVNFDGVWNPSEIRAALQATADDLGVTGRDNFYGYGLVDAEESVTGTQTNP